MSAAFQVINLQVEYSVNPIGIDLFQPRLSWGFESGQRMQSQFAYQVLVASSQDKLAADMADLWDSGKVITNQNCNIVYAGLPLQSGKRYYWKVRAWDANDQPSAYSDQGIWEMALLHSEDWKAQWIGVMDRDIQIWAAENTEDGLGTPLPLFRSIFHLEKEVFRAKVYICGLGHFELRLNGEKVGDHVMDPGWTNYNRSCLYTVFDVTEHVHTGNNAVGVMLGNGFYNVTGGRYAKYLGSFGDPKLILQLEVEYSDGTTKRIVSGEGWQISRGPITFSCIYGGEDYDARLEQTGWDQAGFIEDIRWRRAEVVTGPRGKLQAQNIPPMKVMKAFQPAQVKECSPGMYVYDFGQNFSGWIRMTVEGASGSKVKLTYGELLDEQGMVNQKWTKSPSYFSYTLKGEGVETWSPRFSYSGFRYIQVEGAVPDDGLAASGSQLPVLKQIEGQMIYPDVRAAGAFSCSNPLWNRIHENINWAILSNMKSVLTDCPHREKLGWLEQSHLMGPSIMYNYYVPNLYRKIVGDMSEAQLDNGLVPDIAPEYTVFEEGFRDSPEWGSAYIIANWYAYNWYGDRAMLEQHYEGTKKYVDYLTTLSSGHLLSHGLGDWCDVGSDGFPLHTPIPVTASATYYYNAVIMQKIAGIVGTTEEVQIFAELAAEIKAAFNAEFLDDRMGQYATGSQTSNAMPLALGMVPESLRVKVLENIVQDIREKGNSPSGGEVGLRFMLKALTDEDQAEIISALLNKTDHPSYGYQIMHGATTLTELWDGPTAGLSQNHFMFGHPEEWFYSSLAGIRINYETPSFHHVVIAPHIVDGIQWVKAHHDLRQGRVEVHWQLHETHILQLDVSIPVNTSATVYVPAIDTNNILESGQPLNQINEITLLRQDGKYLLLQIGSGNYRFSIV
ncbi:alpha-L-rhamnosidase [Cohnella silvisoli]|uniref:alpha-L-rhamnosidase n=1 Tax=Cohnella silvisoli TaxID=2873699 RepID=A0ABV1KXT5_9BACL|nr:alpha-L-rhamnosidase [Cohnella silvisoli]MCD9024232.1 glycoside hydrolase family 78 protein [Cohnella silvisoli]